MLIRYVIIIHPKAEAFNIYLLKRGLIKQFKINECQTAISVLTN
jgi:hypothetical protein